MGIWGAVGCKVLVRIGFGLGCTLGTGDGSNDANPGGTVGTGEMGLAIVGLNVSGPNGGWVGVSNSDASVGLGDGGLGCTFGNSVGSFTGTVGF